MRHSKVKGTIAEFYVLSELLKQDFIVSCVQGDYSGYDIVADWNGKLSRIQVKSKTGRETKWGYHLTVGRGNSSKTKYTSADCDIILCVIPEAIFIIPIKEITSLGLRLYPENENSKWSIYKNNWDILK